MYFTHVAMICNIPPLQPLLPQVLFVGAAALTKAQCVTLQSELPHNVYLKRMPKGWNNADEHKVIIQLLGLILAEHNDFKAILIFDAAPLHLAPKVLDAIRTAGLLFLLVPAKLTWLLQPLDRFVFFKFKLHLRQKFAEALLDGSLTVEKVPRMIRLVVHAIRHVLQKESWEPAFKRTGMWGNQSALSSSIKRDLQYQELPSIPSDRPTADMARLCWPRNRPFDAELVMSLIPLASSASSSHTGGLPGGPAPAVAGVASHSTASSSSFPKSPAPAPKRRLRSKTTM